LAAGRANRPEANGQTVELGHLTCMQGAAEDNLQDQKGDHSLSEEFEVRPGDGRGSQHLRSKAKSIRPIQPCWRRSRRLSDRKDLNRVHKA